MFQSPYAKRRIIASHLPPHILFLMTEYNNFLLGYNYKIMYDDFKSWCHENSCKPIDSNKLRALYSQFLTESKSGQVKFKTEYQNEFKQKLKIYNPFFESL